jgi:hypothetical protein
VQISRKISPIFAEAGTNEEPRRLLWIVRSVIWTVISIAARKSPLEKDFLARPSPFLTTAVGGTLLGPPLRLLKIQALLLLSMWPAYNVTWWTDRSYVLSSYAVSAATYLELHSPFFEHEYRDKKKHTLGLRET